MLRKYNTNNINIINEIKEINMNVIQILIIFFLLIFGVLGYIQYRVRQNRRASENTPLLGQSHAQSHTQTQPPDEPEIPVVYVDIV